MLYAVDLSCRHRSIVYRFLFLQKPLRQTGQVSGIKRNNLLTWVADSTHMGQAHHLICGRPQCGIRHQNLHPVYELLQQLLPGEAELGFRDVDIQCRVVGCVNISRSISDKEKILTYGQDFLASFAQLSFSVTVRLNITFWAVLSLSKQK